MLVQYEKRFAFIKIFLLILFVLVSIRLIYVSFKYRYLSEQKNIINITKPRGVIKDSSGGIIASNYYRYSVFMDPSIVTQPEYYAKKFQEILNIDKIVFLSNYEKYRKKRFMWVKRFIDKNTYTKIKTENLKGVYFKTEFERIYPNGDMISPLVGYVNDYQKGMEGIEYQFDSILLPKVDNYMEKIEKSSISLTIDKYLQYILTSELGESFEQENPKWCGGIIQDAKNGEILALSKLPSYNPKDYREYNYSIRKNNLITDNYEPGSTFKLFVAAALLDSNSISLDYSTYCDKYYNVTKNIKINDLKEHGYLTFPQIIKHSSNVGMIKSAESINKYDLFKYLQAFGFGTKTGFLFPGEAEGILKKPENWTKMTKSIINIGQEIGVSALQMISGFSSLINGGKYYEPKIVKDIHFISGQYKKYNSRFIRNTISENVSKTMRNLLQLSVTNGGTGEQAKIEGIECGGKTGTAQIPSPSGGYYEEKNLTSFIGYINYKGRLLSIYLVFYDPKQKKYGGDTAAPLFKRIGEKIVNYIDITNLKVNKVDSNNIDNKTYKRANDRIKEIGIIPDFEGLTLKEAIYLTSKLGLRIKIRGSGFVKYQSLEVGTEYNKGEVIEIKLSRD